MFFGRYLIQKNIISEEQLISALVEQLKTTPPLIKVLSELTDTTSVIKAVNLQMDEGKSLYQVQTECKIFSDEVFENALESQKNSKQPIGQILLSQGALKEKKLEELLMDFAQNSQEEVAAPKEIKESKEESDEIEISDAAMESLKELIDGGTVGVATLDAFDSDNEKRKDETQAVDTETEVEAEVEVSQAALDSLNELAAAGTIDADSLNELKPAQQSNDSTEISLDKYLASLDEDFIQPYMEEVTIKKIKQLNTWIKELNKAPDQVTLVKGLDEIFNTFHKFKGIATLVNAGLSIKIYQVIENKLIKLQSNPDSLKSIESSIDYLLEGLTLIMAISKYIEAKKNEKVALEDPSIAERISAFINNKEK